jgi:hypothetical protein
VKQFQVSSAWFPVPRLSLLSAQLAARDNRNFGAIAPLKLETGNPKL